MPVSVLILISLNFDVCEHLSASSSIWRLEGTNWREKKKMGGVSPDSLIHPYSLPRLNLSRKVVIVLVNGVSYQERFERLDLD